MNVQTRYFQDFKKQMPNDLAGKVFVITGTTSGTGFVAAKLVCELGGEAVLLNRKSSRSDKMLETLKEEVPNGKFVSIECDLQDFSSVRKAISDIKNRYNKIYCLANNAGIMATPDKATVDGYDTQMQTNHLSHFLLTAELFPLLESEANETGDARIVNHSSGARNMGNKKHIALDEKYFGKNGGNLGGFKGGMNFNSPEFERYHQTKLANSVFTYGLHKKLQQKQGSSNNVKVIACHPGGSDTNLGDHIDFNPIMKIMMKLIAPFLFQSQEDGAMGLIKGMIDPVAESGVLYGPANDSMKGIPVVNKPNPWEIDSNAIDMLWKTSEKATGVTFNV